MSYEEQKLGLVSTRDREAFFHNECQVFDAILKDLEGIGEEDACELLMNVLSTSVDIKKVILDLVQDQETSDLTRKKIERTLLRLRKFDDLYYTTVSSK